MLEDDFPFGEAPYPLPSILGKRLPSHRFSRVPRGTNPATARHHLLPLTPRPASEVRQTPHRRHRLNGSAHGTLREGSCRASLKKWGSHQSGLSSDLPLKVGRNEHPRETPQKLKISRGWLGTTKQNEWRFSRTGYQRTCFTNFPKSCAAAFGHLDDGIELREGDGATPHQNC